MISPLLFFIKVYKNMRVLLMKLIKSEFLQKLIPLFLTNFENTSPTDSNSPRSFVQTGLATPMIKHKLDSCFLFVHEIFSIKRKILFNVQTTSND